MFTNLVIKYLVVLQWDYSTCLSSKVVHCHKRRLTSQSQAEGIHDTLADKISVDVTWWGQGWWALPLLLVLQVLVEFPMCHTPHCSHHLNLSDRLSDINNKYAVVIATAAAISLVPQLHFISSWSNPDCKWLRLPADEMWQEHKI